MLPKELKPMIEKRYGGSIAVDIIIIISSLKAPFSVGIRMSLTIRFYNVDKRQDTRFELPAFCCILLENMDKSYY